MKHLLIAIVLIMIGCTPTIQQVPQVEPVEPVQVEQVEQAVNKAKLELTVCSMLNQQLMSYQVQMACVDVQLDEKEENKYVGAVYYMLPSGEIVNEKIGVVTNDIGLPTGRNTLAIDHIIRDKIEEHRKRRKL